MENDRETNEATEKLNEAELERRKMAVNVARSREKRPRFNNMKRGSRRDNRRPKEKAIASSWSNFL